MLAKVYKADLTNEITLLTFPINLNIRFKIFGYF